MRLSVLVTAACLALTAPLTTAACQMVPAPKIDWVEPGSVVLFDLYRGTRLFAPGMVNGHATPLLLDSGASMTTLDRAFARSIGIKPGMKIAGRGAGGPVDAEIVTGITLTIGGMRFDKMSVAVIDLADVATAIGRPMPVILGREFFNSAAIGIDWERKELTLTPTAGFKAPTGATLVPLKARDSFHFVSVSVAGLPPIKALFDLGNGGNLSLPSDYWGKQPALADLRYAESQLGGVGGLHPSRIVTYPSVTFAGQRFDRVPGALGGDSKGNDPAHGSNLGIGLLKPFKVILDLGNSRLFLTPLKIRRRSCASVRASARSLTETRSRSSSPRRKDRPTPRASGPVM